MSTNPTTSSPTSPAIPLPVTSLTSVALGSISDQKLDDIAAITTLAEGVPDPALHDILIVDAPQGLSDPSIEAFLSAGKTVTILNVSEEMKMTSLRRYAPLLASTACKSLALRQGPDPFERTEFFAMEWPDGDRDDSLAFQLNFVDFLGQPSSNVGGSGFNPPPGLQYVTFNYSLTPPVFLFSTTAGGRTNYSYEQYRALTNNYTSRLFLDNGQVATGNRQLLAVESSIRSSPFNPAQGFDGMLAQKTGGFFTDGDMGWFQVSLANRIQPANGNLLTWLADSPANTNNVTTVTTGLSLNIGFLSPSTSTFNYMSSETRELTDWKVDNNGGGTVGDWLYLCQDPYQGDDPDNWRNGGRGGGYTGSSIARGDELRLPNDLSRSELQCNTQIAFRTTGANPILTDVQNFGCSVDISYANFYEHDGPNYTLLPSNNSFTMGLDFNTVNPIPIQSMTFSPSPVVLTGDTGTATGTITLASPARLDTPIFLSSNSQNATVLQSVVIKKGQQSVDFGVDVNSNGLNPGQSTVATFTATYGSNFQAQLTVQR